MINTKIFLEKFLQKQRFKRLKPKYLQGRILDFGGNEGELEPYTNGSYTLVNYDHQPMEGKIFDNIISLAVIEHIEVDQVFLIFKKFRDQLADSGKIFVTTPTPASKLILEILATLGLLDKKNILEHKHYWNKADLLNLADSCGLTVVEYKKFQMGFNQQCVFKKK